MARVGDAQRMGLACGSMLSVAVALNMLRPVVVLHAHSLGLSVALIGLIGSAYAFLPLLCAVFVGGYVDRFGTGRALAIGGVGTLLAAVVPWVFPGFWPLLASQGLIGLSHLFTVVATQSLVASVSEAFRANWLSVYSLFPSLGAVIGPVIAGRAMDVSGYHVPLAIAAGLGLLILLLLAVFSAPPPKVSEDGGYKAVNSVRQGFALFGLPHLRLAYSCVFVDKFAEGIKDSLLVVYLRQVGMSPTYVGILLGAMQAAAVFFRPLAGPLSNRLGTLNSLRLGLALGAGGMVAIPFFESFAPLFIVITLCGIGLSVMHPLTIIMVAEAVDESQRGTALATRLAVNRLAQFVGPSALGAVAGMLGLWSVFAVSGGLIGAVFVWVSSQMARERVPHTVSAP